MEPFISLAGVAAPLLLDDVNTDQITPVHRDLHPDYGKLLFARKRKRADGSDDPDFPLNKPQFNQAKILVTGRNFGCGSSRESAVWAFVAVGIRCIVARSFADIYRDNCLKNGLLPVTLFDADADRLEALVVKTNGAAPFTADLRTQTLTGPSGEVFRFDIAPEDRTILLEGLDDIGLTMKHADAIAAWEARMRQDRPWLQSARRT